MDPEPNERMGSTDMGDISHLIPSIHPYLAIAPKKVAGHTRNFVNIALQTRENCYARCCNGFSDDCS